MEHDLAAYYAQRANEYEAIYNKPERQADLHQATRLLQGIFENQSVLEIACGTGYWTERIAQTAQQILATDLNDSVIAVAKTKDYPRKNVHFEVANLYDLLPDPTHTALFGGFIWSHIPKQDLAKFIQKINALIRPGGTIVFLDNRYVAGSSTPISQRDTWGNTYQERRLQNGTTFSILKNFPEPAELKAHFPIQHKSLEVIELPYYWLLVMSYEL